MLHSISWQSFALILLALIAGYYMLSAAFFYSRELLELAKRKFLGISPSPAVSHAEVPARIEVPSTSLMGAISEEAYEEPLAEPVSADELVFDENMNEVPESFFPLFEQAAPTDNLLIGTVADLLYEIKTLFKMLAEYKSSKEEGSSLLQSLLTKYPQLIDSKFKDPITEFVCDLSRRDLTYALGYQEVNALWLRDTAAVSESKIK